MSESRIRVLFGSFLASTAIAVVVVGQMAFDYASVGSYDTSCPVGDSSGGPSHWRWWLPHGVCDYAMTGHRSSGVVEGVARLLVPACWIALIVVVTIAFSSHIRAQMQDPSDVTAISSVSRATAR